MEERWKLGQLVRWHPRRWSIEPFFRTLKTQGLRIEDGRPASLAFTPREIQALAALDAKVQGRAARQKNLHPTRSLAWAAWIIAKLGGWNEYSTKPPGPITFYNGLAYLEAFAQGWAAKNA